MVRLITHNLLSCPSKLCSYPTNFPLSFRNVSRIELIDQDFNEDFVRGFLSRLEWDALRTSAQQSGGWYKPELGDQQLGDTSLPTERPEFDDPQAVPLDLIQKLHHVLLEIVVMEGEMVCPSPACGHIFRIKDSIPNMVRSQKETLFSS
ncbi:BQ2448_1048 [Microbotryum intermedium]|uniref:BQ2448_1048 protein n=1 Tax=Microbotryum intermedium TaxID=269621 RepID=A0A238FCP7_9BASI|nr:BQ2448_1048 [Microbotryum intermedium]